MMMSFTMTRSQPLHHAAVFSGTGFSLCSTGFQPVSFSRKGSQAEACATAEHLVQSLFGLLSLGLAQLGLPVATRSCLSYLACVRPTIYRNIPLRPRIFTGNIPLYPIISRGCPTSARIIPEFRWSENSVDPNSVRIVQEVMPSSSRLVSYCRRKTIRCIQL